LKIVSMPPEFDFCHNWELKVQKTSFMMLVWWFCALYEAGHLFVEISWTRATC